MALIRGRVNPLNVLGLRKVNFCPPHFAKMVSKNTDKIESIDNWIYARLDSRYCIKKSYSVDSDKKLLEVIEIGIEDPKELSMLSLGCPYLQ
jgi:hypothetical protein